MSKRKPTADRQQCPKCKSAGVVLGYPDIRCLACGWSEPLIDFPISWDWHCRYCWKYGLPDPGPCELPEGPELKTIEERLEQIEQTLTSLTAEDLRQLKLKHIYDEVEDIRQGLRHTQRIVGQAIRSKEVRPGKSKGVKI